MSVGIGMIGREIIMTLGGAALLGVNSKGVTLNNEPMDVTDDNSSGWQEMLARAGAKNVELSISGITKNLELMKAWHGASQIFPVLFTFSDGSTLTFDAFFSTFSVTGESNGLSTFDASFASSGTVTFTPGV